MKALTAFHDGHTQLLLELPDPTRERRLRDAALLRSPGKMLFPGERDKVLKLTDVHVMTRYTETQITAGYQSATPMASSRRSI